MSGCLKSDLPVALAQLTQWWLNRSLGTGGGSLVLLGVYQPPYSRATGLFIDSIGVKTAIPFHQFCGGENRVMYLMLDPRFVPGMTIAPEIHPPNRSVE